MCRYPVVVYNKANLSKYVKTPAHVLAACQHVKSIQKVNEQNTAWNDPVFENEQKYVWWVINRQTFAF